MNHDETAGRVCRYCGGPIVGRRADALYCSPQHQRAALEQRRGPKRRVYQRERYHRNLDRERGRQRERYRMKKLKSAPAPVGFLTAVLTFLLGLFR